MGNYRNNAETPSMTAAEVAEAAGVSVQAVRAWCRRHVGPARPGGSWVLTGRALARVCEHYGVETPESPAETERENSETAAQPAVTPGYVTMPADVYDELRRQIQVKDEQIGKLQELLEHEQVLRAHPPAPALPDAEQPRQSWWKRLWS